MEATDEELVRAVEEVTFDGVSDEEMVRALQTVLPPQPPPPSTVEKTPRLMYSPFLNAGAPSLATKDDRLRELLAFRKREEDRRNGRGARTNMTCYPKEAPDGQFPRTYIEPGGRPRDYCPSPVKERLMANEEMADLYDRLAEVLDMNSWPDSYYDVFHSANLMYKRRLKMASFMWANGVSLDRAVKWFTLNGAFHVDTRQRHFEDIWRDNEASVRRPELRHKLKDLQTFDVATKTMKPLLWEPSEEDLAVRRGDWGYFKK
jgi:hypothetical protein